VKKGPGEIFLSFTSFETSITLGQNRNTKANKIKMLKGTHNSTTNIEKKAGRKNKKLNIYKSLNLKIPSNPAFEKKEINFYPY